MGEAKLSAGPSGNTADIQGRVDQTTMVDEKRAPLATSAAQVADPGGGPYPASWADRLTEWVRGLPLPAWVFYLGVAIISILLISLVPWASGQVPPGTFSPIDVLSGTTGVYLLALLHYLDDWAAAALKRFRPVITVDAAAYERLHYRLTTMPRRPAVIATAIGALYGVFGFMIFGLSDPGMAARLASPVQAILVPITFASSYAMVSLSVYHSIHQLRLVNEIYTHYTRINLFQPGPLYAFSRFAARTAISMSIPTYLWFQATSESSAGDPGAGLGETGFFAVLIALVFVWPLLGAHGLLEKEKERLKDDVSRRIEATILELQSRVDSRDLQDRGALKDTLDGLVATQGVIDKLSTWPWQTQTVSGLGVALLLPIIIWIIQRVLERLGV